MNILILSSKRKWAGVVTWCLNVTKRFREMGHQVHLLSSVNSQLSQKAPEHIPITRFSYGFDFNPLTLLKLIIFIKKHKIDLIIVNIKKEMIFGGIAGRICRVPMIRLIGNEYDFVKIKFWQTLLVDLNIFPCQTAIDNAVKLFPWVQSLKNEVAYIGINPIQIREEEKNEERKRLSLSDGFYIGITSRLIKEKGVDFLLQAFSQIHTDYPQVKIIINGKGPYSDDLIQLAEDLGIRDKVIFGGFAPDSQISASLYDIAVLPSDLEAFPYSVIEYFSVGCPVIATDVGGVHEIIRHNINGVMIPPRDIEKFKIELRKMIENPQFREDIRIEAKKTLIENFTEDVMIKRFKTIFTGCLK